MRALFIALLTVSLYRVAFSQSEQRGPLVNLGMLESTRISASSVNGNREVDNQYYGALNLFDGGENRINNTNYTTWLTDNEPRHWIRLQFEAPVEIDTIMMELPGKDFTAQPCPVPNPTSSPSTYSCVTNTLMKPRPTEFAIDVTTTQNGAPVTRKMPSVEVTGFRLYYPLAKPALNVAELTVVFPGPSILEVSELEVMGIPSKPGSLRPRRSGPVSSK